MTEQIDDDRDPVLHRASAALRAHAHGRAAARAALIEAVANPAARQADQAAGMRFQRIIGIAAAIVISTGVSVIALRQDRMKAIDAVRPAPQTTMVEFSLDAPYARLVSLVGEFNGWNDRATPMRRNASGRWTANLALAPGRHTYDFQVDDGTLIPDPRAPVAPEQLFGVRHSVIVVAGGSGY